MAKKPLDLKKYIERMRRRREPKPPIPIDVKYLSAQDVLRIHSELVVFYSTSGNTISPPGPREPGMVDAAVARPSIGLGGYEKYDSIEAKGAALFHSLNTSALSQLNLGVETAVSNGDFRHRSHTPIPTFSCDKALVTRFTTETSERHWYHCSSSLTRIAAEST